MLSNRFTYNILLFLLGKMSKKMNDKDISRMLDEFMDDRGPYLKISSNFIIFYE